MRMQWRHLLFMHWPVPVSTLRPLIPEALAIDEFDGTAWIGLVPFTMRAVLPAFLPGWPGVGDVRGLTAFHECNVRTYVTHQGQPGVWFFSLDAASRPAVWAARRFFHLPYFHSKMSLDRNVNQVEYSSCRAGLARCALKCVWRIGDPLPQSKPGDHAHFLTERYMLYSANAAGQLFRSRIWHKPWPLQNAELLSLQDGLVLAAGIPVNHTQPPVLHYADELDVRAWRLERL